MRNFLQKKAAMHSTADALGVSTGFLWPLQPSTLNPVTMLSVLGQACICSFN